jgi:hypothetical protein
VSATETWLVIAAIVAFVGALAHLVAPLDPPIVARIGAALTAAAVGLVAVALVVAFP